MGADFWPPGGVSPQSSAGEDIKMTQQKFDYYSPNALNKFTANPLDFLTNGGGGGIEPLQL